MAEDDSTRAPSARNPLSVEDQALGLRLRQARIRSGISQRELAIELGLTSQGLSKLEHGNARISARRLILAANALGVPAAELLGAPDPEQAQDRQIFALVRLFRNLNATQRGSILGLLRALQPSDRP